MMKCIVAVAQDWGIGKDGGLLARNKEDMKFFRSMTVGNVVIMGRKTLESFPGGKPLPDRENIVITREKEYCWEGVHVVHSIVDAEQLANRIADGEKDIFVIGGESIYRQMLDLCQEAYVTRMHKTYEADTYFPNLDERSEWQLTSQSENREYGDGTFCFCTYTRQE